MRFLIYDDGKLLSEDGVLVHAEDPADCICCGGDDCCICTDTVIVECDDGGCGNGSGSHWSDYPDVICCGETYSATLTVSGAMSGGEVVISGNLGNTGGSGTSGSWDDCGEGAEFVFLSTTLGSITSGDTDFDTVYVGTIPSSGLTVTVTFRVDCDSESTECICVRILGGNVIGDGREWLLYPPNPC